MRGKNKRRRPWGHSNKQFFAKMQRLPSRLPEWELEADRLTTELRQTSVMMTKLRREYMQRRPIRRPAARVQFDLTAEALDAHIESLEIELRETRILKR